MTHEHRSNGLPGHREISALLPWYANGSIGEHERQRIDSHLELCGVCRADLMQETRVFQAMAQSTAVEYMPASSLKKLQARLDGADTTAPAKVRPAAPAKRRAMPWPRLMAASVAVMAVAISLLTVDRVVQYRARMTQPSYRTVTDSAEHAADVVVRAVFSPDTTVVELQAMLREAGLRIVSGPSEAGVYSLAADSRLPVSSSLSLLRAHAQVRFAESTQTGAGPGDIP
jgi:hypothetical protein